MRDLFCNLSGNVVASQVVENAPSCARVANIHTMNLVFSKRVYFFSAIIIEPTVHVLQQCSFQIQNTVETKFRIRQHLVWTITSSPRKNHWKRNKQSQGWSCLRKTGASPNIHGRFLSQNLQFGFAKGVSLNHASLASGQKVVVPQWSIPTGCRLPWVSFYKLLGYKRSVPQECFDSKSLKFRDDLLHSHQPPRDSLRK